MADCDQTGERLIRYKANIAGSASVRLVPAALSGVLLGLSYPPADFSWLIWVALVPLLWSVMHQKHAGRLFLIGLVAGTVFYLIATRPLVSAHLWAGWQAGSSADMEGQRQTQFLVLNLLWLVLSVWGGLFWGAFTVALSRLTSGSLQRAALLGPPLIVLLTEWFRSLTSWDYHWAFLGNAAVEVANVRQLAALGGVWLLTWLVVLVNVGILALMCNIRKPRRWGMPAGIAAGISVVLVFGIWRLDVLQAEVEQNNGISVAALQYHQNRYTFDDYTSVGFEENYLNLMGKVAQGEAGNVDLLVLPESIGFGVLSLDGSETSAKPRALHRSLGAWTRVISRTIRESDSKLAIVLGMDTVQGGSLHNSLLFWAQSGLVHWYHKQRPVPFAEYQPASLEFVGLEGENQYERGENSRTVALHGMEIGGFICQEVLVPGVLRRSTANGAELLVSGGNDGVFGSPAVAQVHHNLARLRAVETGRYIVRAMKTGISAVIAPTGAVVRRSPSSEPFVVVARAQPRTKMTAYVRYGDWPLGVAALFLVAGLLGLFYRRKGRAWTESEAREST